MNTSTRWIVRASRFPFAVPGEVVGTVSANDRDRAKQLAAAVYGQAVVVERETPADVVDPFPYKNPLKDQVAALAHASTAMRRMTAIEVQMARAVGVVKYSGQHKGTIRRLHAESFKLAPEISDDLAKKLRAIVQSLRGQLSAELLESVGGGS